jgi:hypothetical protein
MKKYLIVTILLFMFSCKTKSSVVEDPKKVSRLNSELIIEKLYNNKKIFSTIYIKAAAKYVDEKQTQNVTAEIKIEKDKQILVSIRFLGITMAKALITPQAVKYYEKINGSYFEGNFSSLSQWLGTDLDYYKMQNMLLGEALDDLTKGRYLDTLIDQTYQLEAVTNNNTQKTYFIDALTYLLTKQQISQIAESRKIEVSYSDTKTFKECVLPTNVSINAFQKNGKTEINLNYNTITFNENLTFPYSVPSGYKKTIIK